jgi:septum formation protein
MPDADPPPGPPPERLVLASGSAARAAMLRAAGVPFEVEVARVDEASLRDALLAEGASPRDVADALAEMKAAKVGARHAAERALVLGSDQVLDLDGRLLSKAGSPEEALEQLRALSGRSHRLHSAAVLYAGGEPVWRHVGVARLRFRTPSEAYLRDYLARGWDALRHSVGCYHVEGEGARLIEAIEGDHFTVRGLPLLPLLSFLARRGTIPA